MEPTSAKPILVPRLIRILSELLSQYISQYIKIVNRLRNNVYSLNWQISNFFCDLVLPMSLTA